MKPWCRLLWPRSRQSPARLLRPSRDGERGAQRDSRQKPPAYVQTTFLKRMTPGRILRGKVETASSPQLTVQVGENNVVR